MTVNHYARTFLALAALAVSANAATITGIVTNRTSNKPSGGDDVTLIRLAQGMQEATHAKTDARGHYTLDVPDDGIHLVRVTHQGANYFLPATPGTQAVDMDVYDVAAKVAGVSLEADVMRIQTDPSGKMLSVTENFYLKNASDPPRTQFGERPFDFYLPTGAVIEGSVASAPQPADSALPSMPVQVAPTALPDKGHYAFVFPIRPGEPTRFQVSYHLPYDGSLKLTPRPTMAGGDVIAMLPTGMSFKGGDAYALVPADKVGAGAQAYAVAHASAGQTLDFTVSGTGTLPHDVAGAQQPQQGDAQTSQVAAGPDMRPGGGLGVPIDPEATHDPWAKYKWWILSLLALLLAGAAGFLVQKPAQRTVMGPAAVPVAPAQGQRSLLLTALKEELFALETERVEGKLSEESYAEQKAALETVLRRALARGNRV